MGYWCERLLSLLFVPPINGGGMEIAMKILLASGSPRRFALLSQMGWEVETCSFPFAEVKSICDAETHLQQLQKKKKKKSTDSKALLFDENDITLLSPYRNADLVCAYNALGKAGQGSRPGGKN